MFNIILIFQYFEKMTLLLIGIVHVILITREFIDPKSESITEIFYGIGLNRNLGPLTPFALPDWIDASSLRRPVPISNYRLPANQNLDLYLRTTLSCLASSHPRGWRVHIREVSGELRHKREDRSAASATELSI